LLTSIPVFNGKEKKIFYKTVSKNYYSQHSRLYFFSFMLSIDNDFFVFKFTQNGLRVYEKHELKIFLKKFEKVLAFCSELWYHS